MKNFTPIRFLEGNTSFKITPSTYLICYCTSVCTQTNFIRVKSQKITKFAKKWKPLMFSTTLSHFDALFNNETAHVVSITLTGYQTDMDFISFET